MGAYDCRELGPCGHPKACFESGADEITGRSVEYCTICAETAKLQAEIADLSIKMESNWLLERTSLQERNKMLANELRLVQAEITELKAPSEPPSDTCENCAHLITAYKEVNAQRLELVAEIAKLKAQITTLHLENREYGQRIAVDAVKIEKLRAELKLYKPAPSVEIGGTIGN